MKKMILSAALFFSLNSFASQYDVASNHLKKALASKNSNYIWACASVIPVQTEGGWNADDFGAYSYGAGLISWEKLRSSHLSNLNLRVINQYIQEITEDLDKAKAKAKAKK